MQRGFSKLALSGLLLGLPFFAHAATPVNLNQQSASTIATVLNSSESFKEISRSVDFNKTLHVRVQQMYGNYPVYGADAVVHIPQGADTEKSLTAVLNAAKTKKGSMNGTIYKNLSTDLNARPADIFLSMQQIEKAQQQSIIYYQQKVDSKVTVKDIKSQALIYVDKNNKAHFAYQITFLAPALKKGGVPEQPVYIVDAISFVVYEQWNDMRTLDTVLNNVDGGGFGGNQKMGQLVYDGLGKDLPKLPIKRDPTTQICYFQNQTVSVKKCTVFNDYYGCLDTADFTISCSNIDPNHNNVYWDGDQDAVNGGYSPSNDALFEGEVIRNMYQKWYDVPVLINPDGSPMRLNMVVHLPYYDNAYWNSATSTMYFGDGETLFYPLTSLGVAAHEISHGFTSQHSNLVYKHQSGGMNESFSDMAAQAAEFYAYGKNNWQIAPEIFKAPNEALRYMDQPSKDGRSIDNASQYYDGLNVHYSSGVYNRLFYLMGTSSGWNTKKAFDVMVQANRFYWTSQVTFAEGACGVLHATKDYGYDTKAVLAALNEVGITTSSILKICK